MCYAAASSDKEGPRCVPPPCSLSRSTLERRTAWGGRESMNHGAGGHDDRERRRRAARHASGPSRDRRFLRRRTLLDTIVRDGRRHPFSQFETTVRDDVKIYASAFDPDMPASRAATGTTGGQNHYLGDFAPVLVVEAVLRIVLKPDCDVLLEEIRWISTTTPGYRFGGDDRRTFLLRGRAPDAQ